jgi:hypothetical protein
LVIPTSAAAQVHSGDLGATSCTSARSCVAVRRYDDSSGATLTLAEVWNGKHWGVEATPNPAGA